MARLNWKEWCRATAWSKSFWEGSLQVVVKWTAPSFSACSCGWSWAGVIDARRVRRIAARILARTISLLRAQYYRHGRGILNYREKERGMRIACVELLSVGVGVASGFSRARWRQTA